MTVDSTISETTVPASTEMLAKPPESEVNEGIAQYTDGYSYEVPRPFLTLQQAAAIMGKSLRSIERSLLGRWGNKLPEGWVARKMRTSNGDEWRILPPPGFRVKLATNGSNSTDGRNGTGTNGSANSHTPRTEYDTEENYEMTQYNNSEYAARKRPSWKPDRHSLEQPTIVIDRSEEVEHLLRDLVTAQRALAEERRLHMEDLRMITQLQSSMRLLESNVAEQTKVKSELEAAKQELTILKDKYTKEISTPWWRRMFKGQD